MIRRCLLILSLWSLQHDVWAAAEEVIYPPQLPMPVPGFALKNTANFDDLRHNVLDLISSSKKRVWLITDYLTDGDVVSALFLAKYRKLDVKVFLGRAKQNNYLSRLNYLKSQNIPVFTRPEHGFIAPTLIFTDQRLYTINRDLNGLSRGGSAQLAQASPSDVKNFVTWFRDTLDYPEPAQARPEVPVSQARGTVTSQGARRQNQESSYGGEEDGSYNYNRSNLSRRAPEGVPTQLPRVPVWQKNRETSQKNRILPTSVDDESSETKAAPGSPANSNTHRLPEPSAPQGAQGSDDPLLPGLPSTAQPSEEHP
ncbi:MAG: hypothetical protein NTX25_10070 [Proteobacteria bacterium]|nr:hypothetical protein [Pseudomonadota bacterium]